MSWQRLDLACTEATHATKTASFDHWYGNRLNWFVYRKILFLCGYDLLKVCFRNLI